MLSTLYSNISISSFPFLHSSPCSSFCKIRKNRRRRAVIELNMTEERNSNVYSDEPSQTRQRRKRKWDQPAESLVSAPLIQQHADAITQLLNMPKIQDELTIAREVVINDAESSVRYKLTKRQTQEEIKQSTGAVVITRGKYHPPNAPPDCEKPLYLHISAGAHLKDTAERILSVDRAASMVEEMLKQHASHAISERVFLGFDPEPSLNIAARICGPNDQYINHIMNETGVYVILRGRASGKIENSHVEEGPEPLHLFLSSNDSKSLENAKHLAENLLDTISIECGVSRVSSSKVYSCVPTPQQVYRAVPPPQHLLAGVQASSSSATDFMTLPPSVSTISPVFDSAGPPLSCGTSYSGYGGIYPRATPLQQVAHVLRQSASPEALTSLLPSTEPNLSLSSKEKRPPQKRKFQELPITSKSSAKPIQGSDVERRADISGRNVLSMPAPKKFLSPTSNLMPPPPPKKFVSPTSNLMPPPPPKLTSASPCLKQQDKNNALNKVKPGFVSDTLVKLMEYGDDDDDEEQDENGDESVGGGDVVARKPFWAL